VLIAGGFAPPRADLLVPSGAAAGAAGGGGEAELPERFFKLPRIRFLLLLSKEILRINRLGRVEQSGCPMRRGGGERAGCSPCAVPASRVHTTHLYPLSLPATQPFDQPRFISAFGEDRFTSLDVQRCGRLAIVAVRGFVKAVSPGASDAQVCVCGGPGDRGRCLLTLSRAHERSRRATPLRPGSGHGPQTPPTTGQVSEHIHAFVATAEAAVRDVAPEAVAVGGVAELGREAFVAGVSGALAVRDHIKVYG
jgi:hypothetical protein